MQEEGLSGEKRAHFVENISGQAQKLVWLGENFSKISRLDTGMITLRPKLRLLAPVLLRAVDQVSVKAQDHGNRIRFEAEQGIKAWMDLKWTEEAFFNLLDNAVKYAEAGTEIGVEAEAYELFVRVDIRNTGPLIKKEEYARIFGRFYRGQGTEHTPGVGLGLYIAREIVRRQGGLYEGWEDAEGRNGIFRIPAERGEGMRVYLMDIRNVDQEEENRLLGLIGEMRRRKAAEYRRAEDRLRSVCAGALLYHAVCCLLHDEGTEEKPDLTLKYGASGKPCLAGYPGFHFNLSHSGNYVACAAGRTPVGVDIQEYKEISPALARRFLNSRELEYLRSAEETGRRRVLLNRFWAAKESCLKLTGEGITRDMRGITVCLEDGVILYGEEKILLREWNKEGEYSLALSYFPESVDTAGVRSL